MPKLRTNKSAAKRFKSTKSGKFKRSMAYGSHLLTHKTAKRKRRLRKGAIVEPQDQRRVKRMLPYS